MRGLVLGVGGLAGAVLSLVFLARPYETLLLSMFVFGSGLDVFLPGPVALALLAVATGRALYSLMRGQSLYWGTHTIHVWIAILMGMALACVLLEHSCILP